MSNRIANALQPSLARVGQFVHCARTTWTLVNAVIAVVAGISTLNMAVANAGLATLNELASPIIQQFARLSRQA